MTWMQAKYGDIETAQLAKVFDLEVSWSSDRSRPGYVGRFAGLTLSARYATKDEAKQAVQGLARSRLVKALDELAQPEAAR